jgi:hypothetical protein
MLPSKNDPKLRKLVTGELSHDFKAVAASMMLSRLRRSIQADGGEANILACIEEFHAFVQKYEKVMDADMSAIFG